MIRGRKVIGSFCVGAYCYTPFYDKRKNSLTAEDILENIFAVRFFVLPYLVLQRHYIGRNPAQRGLKRKIRIPQISMASPEMLRN